MPAVFTHTNPVTLRRIAQDLIITPANREWLWTEVFPIEEVNAVMLRWVIEENYSGLMAARGVGGEPVRINTFGMNGYEATPGYFGNFGTLDEQEMLARSMAVAGIKEEIPMSVNDLIQRQFDIMKVLYLNRMKQMGGDLLANGTMFVTLPDGAKVTLANYTQIIDSPSTPYTTVATATPYKDALTFQSRHGRGTSSQFNAQATRWMNSRTFLLYQLNRNGDDLFGKKNVGGDSLGTLDEINKVFMGASAPKIALWDGFYLGDGGEDDVIMDIPDGVEYIIGARPQGEKPGNFQMTANANNPNNAPGVYAFVQDYTKGPLKTVPPTMKTQMGFNGAPVMRRPRQVIKRVVATQNAMDTLLGAIV